MDKPATPSTNRHTNSAREQMLDETSRQDIAAALGRIPSGLFILTARHEERRTGMLASWVQQVCFEPPMVSISVAKGRAIMPLISESHRFALCQLPAKDRIYFRKFASGLQPGEDPFLGLELIEGAGTLGMPILADCVAWLECELTCHMDVEGDHDLFIGAVRGGDYRGGEPYVHIRDSGFKY